MSRTKSKTPPRPGAVPLLPPGWQRAIWAAVIACGALLVCSEWYGPDIWYHLYLGDRIFETHSVAPTDRLLAPPALFINIYWLFQVTVSLLHRLGEIWTVSLFFLACWAVAFRCWWRTTGAWRAGLWGAWLMLAAILVCQPRFDPRPEVVSYALLALQIHWLTTWEFTAPISGRKIALFVLSEVVWANVHGFFPLGPLLVGARLIAALLVARGTSTGAAWLAPRTLALLLGATLGATVLSPLGVRTWECVFLLSKTLRDLRFDIQEFAPPTGVNLRLWTVKVFWIYWLLLCLGSAITLFRAPRRSFFALATCVAGLVLGAVSLRNLPLLVFLGGPIVAELLPLLPVWRRAARALAATTVTACAALAIWVVGGGFHESLGSQSGFGPGVSFCASPVRFAEYWRRVPFEGKLFNAARDGGYLEFHFPQSRIYGDSRFVEVASVRAYFAAASRWDDFKRLHAAQQFDAVLLPVDIGRGVIPGLVADPTWRLAYADLHRAFFVNVNSAAARTLPPERLEFYRGEDLTLRKNGPFAAQWMASFALANDRRRLVLALQQFSAAPRIPSFVGEFALRFAHERGDREIVRLVRTLRPKLEIASAEDRRELEAAFAATAAF